MIPGHFTLWTGMVEHININQAESKHDQRKGRDLYMSYFPSCCLCPLSSKITLSLLYVILHSNHRAMTHSCILCWKVLSAQHFYFFTASEKSWTHPSYAFKYKIISTNSIANRFPQIRYPFGSGGPSGWAASWKHVSNCGRNVTIWKSWVGLCSAVMTIIDFSTIFVTLNCLLDNGVIEISLRMLW